MNYTSYGVFIVAALLSGVATPLKGQSVRSQSEINPDTAFDNVHVQKLEDTSEATSFIIWVKRDVPPHLHNSHTEHVYVIEGEGVMLMGKDYFEIKPGDVIAIPPGTIHAVQTTSSKPLKVISIQAPRFTGKDREFTETDLWPPVR